MVHFHWYQMEADGSRPPNYTAPGDIILQNIILCPGGVIHIIFYIMQHGGPGESR